MALKGIDNYTPHNPRYATSAAGNAQALAACKSKQVDVVLLLHKAGGQIDQVAACALASARAGPLEGAVVEQGSALFRG